MPIFKNIEEGNLTFTVERAVVDHLEYSGKINANPKGPHKLPNYISDSTIKYKRTKLKIL